MGDLQPQERMPPCAGVQPKQQALGGGSVGKFVALTLAFIIAMLARIRLNRLKLASGFERESEQIIEI